jgi:hypothetical protein
MLLNKRFMNNYKATCQQCTNLRKNPTRSQHTAVSAKLISITKAPATNTVYVHVNLLIILIIYVLYIRLFFPYISPPPPRSRLLINVLGVLYKEIYLLTNEDICNFSWNHINNSIFVR